VPTDGNTVWRETMVEHKNLPTWTESNKDISWTNKERQ